MKSAGFKKQNAIIGTAKDSKINESNISILFLNKNLKRIKKKEQIKHSSIKEGIDIIIQIIK